MNAPLVFPRPWWAGVLVVGAYVAALATPKRVAELPEGGFVLPESYMRRGACER